MKKLFVCALTLMTVCSLALSQGAATEALQTCVLRVSSYRLDRVSGAIDRFLRAHPGASVEGLTQLPAGPDNMFVHMRSGEADIYELDLDCGYFISLRDKGYLADLSFNEALLQAVGRMSPQLTGSFLTDGRLYAVPVQLTATMPGYNPAALERLGLSAADLPVTWSEMLDFAAHWEDVTADSPETQLFYLAPDVRTSLFDAIMDAQFLRCESSNEALAFDTPALQALLTRLDALYPAGAPVGDYVYGGNYLFSLTRDPLPTNQSPTQRPLPLSVEGEDTVIRAKITVWVVNPYSAHIDLAAELLAEIVSALPDNLQAAMTPEDGAPIEAAAYATTVAPLRQRIAELEASLAIADPADRAELESQLRDCRAQEAAAEAARWAYGSDDIAQYRQLVAPFLTVSTVKLFDHEDAAMFSLRQRWLDGQLGTEAFLHELDRMVAMKRMENQ